MTSSNRQLVAAFFTKFSDAENAIRELRDRGFTSNQIGTSIEHSDIDRFSEAGGTDLGETKRAYNYDDNRSFWEKMKDFFSGESDDYGTRTNERTQVTDNEFGAIRTSGYNIPERFHTRLASGGAYVTVQSSRVPEAEEILVHNHGQVDREFETGIREGVAGTSPVTTAKTGVTGTENVGRDRNVVGGRRIQLLSEVLRIDKERVSTGEVRVRKEVHTEHQNVSVPVEREELVVERRPATGETPASGTIGAQDEVRIPLTEERVKVSKTPVVKEEVEVGKRKIQKSENVSEDVRSEDLKVEDERKPRDVKGKDRKIA
ncbi:MAG TPA: YsnF/AvaK domain-containing protein [Terriglobales bacterium]